MKARPNLTGLHVARHRYPDPPLLDGACRGLRLVASPPIGARKDRGSWVYRYRTREGRLRQIKLGEYPEMGLAEARKAWGNQKGVRDDLARGDPRRELERIKASTKAEVAATRLKAYTVVCLCQDYLAEHVEKRRVKAQEPRRLLEREVIPRLGTKPAIQVTRESVHDVIQCIVDRGASRIAQMTRGELRAAFAHAVAAGRLPDNHSNPCDRVKVPPYRRRNRAFSEPELTDFLKWLPNAKVSASVRAAMSLELLTAARQGEIVAMQWKHVDMARGIWRQPTSKNGQPHEVMLSSQARRVITDRLGLSDVWVFPRPDRRGHIASKAVGIQQYAAKASLQVADWTVHDLRRSALTGLARLGCSRVVQDRIANHCDKSVAAIYDRYSYEAEARNWLQRWADHLDLLSTATVVKVEAA